MSFLLILGGVILITTLFKISPILGIAFLLWLWYKIEDQD